MTEAEAVTGYLGHEHSAKSPWEYLYVIGAQECSVWPDIRTSVVDEDHWYEDRRMIVACLMVEYFGYRNMRNVSGIFSRSWKLLWIQAIAVRNPDHHPWVASLR